MPPKRRGTKAAVVPTSHPAAGPAGDASAERRITRLRSRELGLEAAGAGDVASDDPGPVRKKRKVHPTVGGKSVRAAAAARADPPARPQPPDLPPYPKSGNSNDILNWAIEFRRICALPGPDIVIPCTVRREPEDTRTARDVASTADKSLILKAARSVVGISSSMPDGKILHCTGIVVDWNETRKLATIVTCSATVCYDGALVHPKPKLLVRLPNKATAKGQLLFFNAHYRIALLEALVDSPLEPANFGSSPKFGQQVFALARDKQSSLFARRGTVLWEEPPIFLKSRYLLSLSSEIALCGTGGPAIDEHGNVVGMTFSRLPNPDILSISILQTCIEMWRKCSRVACPFLGMDLRAFGVLDVSHQEEIQLEHGISDGFIVDMVCTDYIASSLGISNGDVIVSYNGHRDFTLHTFEKYLLNLGWGFLGSFDSSWTTDLEVLPLP
ncbi:hypothetical protein E2562_027011 [Oryza meyeriana var. granulata]|uniref:PDZ domain-containing protein n=1 Tax=Oryza meyeriana var. granulata TaxID=110450 RepID=A0A6G1EPW3_9ORYZ|nr:hypothetical protein E2562_027011 [Oryza meyeriana var. granulata]